MGIYNFSPDDAQRFAIEVGIKTRTRGKELQFLTCPYCRASDKYTFSISLRDGTHNCKRASCGRHGNMITLAQDFGFSLGNDADEYYSQKKRYRSLSNYPRPETRPKAIEYLNGRGISREIVERYSITTKEDNEEILAFPFYDEKGKLQFVKYRNTGWKDKSSGSKEWCLSKCKPILFGMDRCNFNNPVLIMTEGQIDSLSVAECGIENAVSVPTGAKGFTWVPYCWNFLCRFHTLIVFGDHENEHITLLDEMARRFPGTIKHVQPDDYLDCKDANEILQKHGRAAIVRAIEQAVPIENPRIKRLSEVERKDMTKLKTINSGIRKLDQMIGGFHLGQLVILTGERGLGKSTLASQFCVQAVQQKKTVFLYSGELMDWYVQDWFDRQAAGPQHIEKIVAENGSENFLVRSDSAEKIHEWYDELCFVYDNQIINNDCEEDEELLTTVETAIKQYGCDVILLDNLMTAIEDDMSADLYRQQSVFVRKLAWLAKKYEILIILIVHPRKANGMAERRNDDVAGSSNITNLADVVLWYEKPDSKNEDDQQDDGMRMLKVTKNRLNGKVTKGGIQLWFDEASKRISEREGVFSGRYGWESLIDTESKFVSADDDYETGEIPF